MLVTVTGVAPASSEVLRDSIQVVVFIWSTKLSIYQSSRTHLIPPRHNYHACCSLQTHVDLASTGQLACLQGSYHCLSAFYYLNPAVLGSQRHFCTGPSYQTSTCPSISGSCQLSFHFGSCSPSGPNFSSSAQGTHLDISCCLLSSSALSKHSRLSLLTAGSPHSLASCRRRPFRVCSMEIHGNLWTN